MAERRDSRPLSGHQRLVPRRDRPVQRPAPLADPRQAPKVRVADAAVLRAGRRAALVLAGVGIFWIAATAAGGSFGWSARVRALLDLFALAGFGVAIYLTWQVWRLRRADKGSQ